MKYFQFHLIDDENDNILKYLNEIIEIIEFELSQNNNVRGYVSLAPIPHLDSRALRSRSVSISCSNYRIFNEIK